MERLLEHTKQLMKKLLLFSNGSPQPFKYYLEGY